MRCLPRAGPKETRALGTASECPLFAVHDHPRVECTASPEPVRQHLPGGETWCDREGSAVGDVVHAWLVVARLAVRSYTFTRTLDFILDPEGALILPLTAPETPVQFEQLFRSQRPMLKHPDTISPVRTWRFI